MTNKTIVALMFSTFLLAQPSVLSKDSDTMSKEMMGARNELSRLLKEDTSPACLFGKQNSNQITYKSDSRFEKKRNGNLVISEGAFLVRPKARITATTSDATIQIPAHSIVLIVKTASNDERIYCLFSNEDVLIEVDRRRSVKLHTRQALEMSDGPYIGRTNLMQRIGARLSEKLTRDDNKSAMIAEFYVIRCIATEPLLRAISLSNVSSDKQLIQELLTEYVAHAKEESIKGQYLQIEPPKD